MSARTPFIPQRSSRAPPPSHTGQSQASLPPSQDAFRPTGLLPVSVDSSASGERNPQSETHTSGPSDDDTSIGGINKPLNLSGLTKKKQQHTPGGPGKPRKSFEDASIRSRSPMPSISNQQALRLAAPRPSSPFFPSSSNFVSMTAFRTPALPTPSKLQHASTADEMHSNRAHVSNFAPVTDDPHAHSNTAETADRFQSSHSLNPLMKTRIRSSSHPSLEKIHEVAEEVERIDDRGPVDNQGFDNRHGQIPGNMYEEHPSSDPADEGEEHTQQPLRRTSKRLQRNDEEELDYGAVSKRYKMEMSQSQYEMSYSRQTTPAVHYSPEVRPGNIDGTNSHTSNPHMPDRRNNSPYSHVMGMQVAPAPTHDGHGHALFKLLGQDMDAYVDSHMDAYEQARKKWSECSMDEWTTGADELAGKFTKMLDFVKDHMTSKLTLYASLHNKISAHREVLSDREDTLKQARESLVREGGNVVGGGSAALGVGREVDQGNGGD